MLSVRFTYHPSYHANARVRQTVGSGSANAPSVLVPIIIIIRGLHYLVVGRSFMRFGLDEYVDTYVARNEIRCSWSLYLHNRITRSIKATEIDLGGRRKLAALHDFVECTFLSFTTVARLVVASSDHT